MDRPVHHRRTWDGREEIMRRRPWMDHGCVPPRLPVSCDEKKKDPWPRQAPLSGVRCDCRVKVMHVWPVRETATVPLHAPGGGGPAAGGIAALASRTCVPCVPCGCPRGARPAVRAELGGRGNGQEQAMAPGPAPAPRTPGSADRSTWLG